MSISFIYPQYLWLLLLVPLMIALGLTGRSRFNRNRLWAALVARTILTVALVLALAGIQLRLRSNTLTNVFILDASDSISSAEQSRGETLIRQAIQGMRQGDKAAVVVFGEDSLVERLASEDRFFSELGSTPITVRTNIASALQLAQAILPGEGYKRMVLFSDGRQNIGEAIEQAELAASQEVELLYVPLGGPLGDVEVLVESLSAPTEIRQGEDFTLKADIWSSAQVNATLRVFENDNLIQSREIQLQPANDGQPTDTNQQIIEIESSATDQASESAKETGFRRFRVQIVPDSDTRLQNNQASAFTVVKGPPSVLVVEGETGEGENLARALSAAEMKTVQVSPASLPTKLEELANYDAVVLVDVNASALPTGVMDTLQTYVRDLGMGLVMVGGRNSFGAGGYLRTPVEEALPVDMDVRNKDLQANLALILAIDKSGSMGRCHCDNPDLFQSYTPSETGQAKVDIAKEAIMRAAGALGNQDFLGILAFDEQPRWVLPVGKLVDSVALEKAISSFQAEGQTNLQAGVETAFQSLQDVPAHRKHIILVTDGWVREGDLTALVQEMKDRGITLSIVAAGQGSAEYLKALSEVSGGSYYPAVDPLSVPDIFLQETVKSTGEYIIEEPFYPLTSAPSSILQNQDVSSLPPLLGYNGTTAKKTARLDLITSRGDPLLATWQYGLGRSAVWTSDFKGQWGIQWLEWDGFERFANQLVKWVLPTPKVEGLTANVSLQGNQATVNLEAVDKNGLPLNFLEGNATLVNPELETVELPMKQVGAGKYQATSDVSTPGTYLVRLGVNDEDQQSLGQVTLGLVVPYSPEYLTSGADLGLLGELANITGGSELVDLKNVFEHDLPATKSAHEIWQSLLLLAALLFPLDVAIRRLSIRSSDIRKARAWLREKIVVRGKERLAQQPLLNQLFQARERARQKQTVKRATQLPFKGKQSSPSQQQPVAEPATPLPSREDEEQARTGEAVSGDSLARLREAKKRVRR
jgi:uncharacterized membrane protein/Mg-chelatase subunit ChlD